MRAIVNGKLYDTEKAEHTTSICLSDAVFEVYITQKRKHVRYRNG